MGDASTILEGQRETRLTEDAKHFRSLAGLFFGHPSGVFINEVKIIMRFPEGIMVVLKGSKEGQCLIAFSSGKTVAEALDAAHEGVKAGKVTFKVDEYGTAAQRAWAQWRSVENPVRPQA